VAALAALGLAAGILVAWPMDLVNIAVRDVLGNPAIRDIMGMIH
jgi:hypothetical protein